MSYKYHPDLHQFMKSGQAIAEVPAIAEKRAVWRDFCLSLSRPVAAEFQFIVDFLKK